IATMRPLFSRPLAPLDADELRTFGRFDALRGLDVSVSAAGVGMGAGPRDGERALMRGTVTGIAPDGALLLDVDGDLQRVATGTVRLSATSTHFTPGTP